MGRRAAKITRDEVERMIKAAQSCGLTVACVRWGDLELDVVQDCEESGEKSAQPLAGGTVVNLIREPKA